MGNNTVEIYCEAVLWKELKLSDFNNKKLNWTNNFYKYLFGKNIKSSYRTRIFEQIIRKLVKAIGGSTIEASWGLSFYKRNTILSVMPHDFWV